MGSVWTSYFVKIEQHSVKCEAAVNSLQLLLHLLASLAWGMMLHVLIKWRDLLILKQDTWWRCRQEQQWVSRYQFRRVVFLTFSRKLVWGQSFSALATWGHLSHSHLLALRATQFPQIAAPYGHSTSDCTRALLWKSQDPHRQCQVSSHSRVQESWCTV